MNKTAEGQVSTRNTHNIYQWKEPGIKAKFSVQRYILGLIIGCQNPIKFVAQ